MIHGGSFLSKLFPLQFQHVSTGLLGDGFLFGMRHLALKYEEVMCCTEGVHISAYSMLSTHTQTMLEIKICEAWKPLIKSLWLLCFHSISPHSHLPHLFHQLEPVEPSGFLQQLVVDNHH